MKVTNDNCWVTNIKLNHKALHTGVLERLFLPNLFHVMEQPRICMWVKKLQLEPHMEKPTGSKLVREYTNSVYCHPAYLMYIQSTTCKMLGWMSHKLESRLLGEISIMSDMYMMEKAMAPHSSTPAWKIPWMEEPGRLQSMGSLKVGYD